ncbi:putative membrane protein [Pyrobaculum oguniense TE7]|uniref:Membrane protein n=1 Tax=Pyrobaculum oguniense (strain DSM 13380 / JCM 10595 / TE7) TaxID=698757 RepID=H6Q663_PYROT|nr:putative membrane protein [Pyrobaculum oguniense TE7]
MRVLVLYVDRDGDIKAQGFDTPVLGRDEVLRLAIRYILANPDDSDANAIFAAVKIHDRLVAEHGSDNVNVAVVSGSPDPALADIAVLRELEQVLTQYDADVIYFVSDGPSDEAAVAAIQTKRPVVSVYRVVVKQARGVEETVTLFRYYLNKAIKEPEYRRYTVGVPAFLAFVALLGTAFNTELVRYILNMLLLFISFFITLYGFGIYDFLRDLLKKYEITFILTLVSLFIIVVYLAMLILGERWMPYYILLVASAVPFLSYMVEGYLATGRLRYGGVVGGAATFFFFYFIMPVILERRGLVETLTAVGLFAASIAVVVVVVQVLRRVRRR